jgi:predicted nucleic acid-binding protein
VIVVDTSVWIDLSRRDDSPQSRYMRSELSNERGAEFALTDVVFAEFLQGLPENVAEQAERQLLQYPVLRLEGLEDFRRAAALYRQARSKGVTIRRTSDCLIASVCIREDVPLLHRDADFDRLAETTDLRVVEL